MTAITISNSANRLNDFETTVSTTSIGGGAAAALETVTFFQGAQSVSRKCSTGDKGFYVTGLTSTDMTNGDNKVWMSKIFVSDGTDATSTGIRLYIGNTTANNYELILYDDGTNKGLYPITRSWLILPWDPNVPAFYYATNGTPNLTAVAVTGIVVNLTNGTAKSENVFMDSIDLSDGLYMVGGTFSDAPGTFQDFHDYDENTQSNRFGHVISQEGIYYVAGKLIIGRPAAAGASPNLGTPTDTHFDDTGSVLVFPESYTDTGWNEIEVDISSSAGGSPNSYSIINFTSCTFNGRGTGAARAFFGTTADVDGGNETITLTGYTGRLRTGDAVVYSNEGGAQNIGLTSGNTYWLFETATPDVWSIHPSWGDGLAGTNAINLTAGGTETHSFQKTPDGRPNLTVTGTTGYFTADSCTFDSFGILDLTSRATLNACNIVGCEQLNQNNAVISGCVITTSTTEDGEAFILCDNLSNIYNTDFIFSDGHAIELTSGYVGGSPVAFDLVGNTFTGFGSDGTNDAVIYNNTGTHVTLNVLSGDTPTVRNGTGSTTTINNSVTLLVQGVTEGAAVKIVANETVGTITSGDVLMEKLANANGQASTSLNYEGAFVGSPAVDGLEVITRVRSSGLPTAAIQDDNGSYTDETTAANSAIAADMHLLPTTPVVNEDRYLFGHAEMFNKMKIAINTAGTGGFTITWQYWNGAWTNLSNVIDDTNSFSVTGTNYVSFTMPGDWTKTTINGQGPYYYIRAAYTAGTVTVSPTGTRCSLDVNKYLPFVQSGTVTSSGLTVTASWVRDTIATF